jgi:hypothetical protein
MPIIVKNKTVKPKKTSGKKAIRKFKMPDLSKDPYFVTKAEEAKADLIRSGMLKP